jgi:hypothetical protein
MISMNMANVSVVFFSLKPLINSFEGVANKMMCIGWHAPSRSGRLAGIWLVVAREIDLDEHC